MEWLDEIIGAVEGITEEQKTAITKGFNAEFPKNAVPKNQYAKKIAELEAANAQISESTIKIETLSKSSATVGELKKQLETIKEEHDTFKADVAKREINSTKLEGIKKMLSKHFAADAVDLIASTYNLEEITLTEKGEVVDAESKIATQKAARPSLVITESANSNPPNGGDPVTPVTDTSKLTDEEYYASLRKE